MLRSDSAATENDDLTVTPFVVGKPKLAGDEGVWFFITADISMFAVLFTAFMFVRAQQPALFEQSRHALNPALGTLNTLILLASSWLVALAVHAARDGKPAAVSRYLLSSILVGSGFAVSKVCEYTAKIKAGITLLTNDFFMYYYVLTGLHFLHFIIGMGVLLVCWSKSRSDPIDRNFIVWIESSGCYWHMVDLLWIFLFPMLYLLRQP